MSIRMFKTMFFIISVLKLDDVPTCSVHAIHMDFQNKMDIGLSQRQAIKDRKFPGPKMYC